MAAGPETPKAFKTLLGAMYWPSAERMPSAHLLIADALRALRPDEHIVAKQCIDELVSSRHSDAEIKRLEQDIASIHADRRRRLPPLSIVGEPDIGGRRSA